MGRKKDLKLIENTTCIQACKLLEFVRANIQYAEIIGYPQKDNALDTMCPVYVFKLFGFYFKLYRSKNQSKTLTYQLDLIISERIDQETTIDIACLSEHDPICTNLEYLSEKLVLDKTVGLLSDTLTQIKNNKKLAKAHQEHKEKRTFSSFINYLKHFIKH